MTPVPFPTLAKTGIEIYGLHGLELPFSKTTNQQNVTQSRPMHSMHGLTIAFSKFPQTFSKISTTTQPQTWSAPRQPDPSKLTHGLVIIPHKTTHFLIKQSQVKAEKSHRPSPRTCLPTSSPKAPYMVLLHIPPAPLRFRLTPDA